MTEKYHQPAYRDTAALGNKLGQNLSEVPADKAAALGLSVKIYDQQDRTYQILEAGAFTPEERAAIDEHNTQVRAAQLRVILREKLHKDVSEELYRFIGSTVPKVLDVGVFQLLVQPLRVDKKS